MSARSCWRFSPPRDILRWMFFEQYSHEPNVATPRFWLLFVGALATLADVALYPYTHVCEAGGFRLRDYPAICRWLGRVSGLPGYVPMD